MRNQITQPIIQLTKLGAIGYITYGYVGPLYFIGTDTLKELMGIEGLSQIGGAVCALFSAPFIFTFTNNDINQLGNQWFISNKKGKTLLASSFLVFLSAGIPNAYYMRGNIADKIIAFFAAGIPARAIFTDWALRSFLALRNRKTDRFYRLLTMLKINLLYNDQFEVTLPLSNAIKKAINANNYKALPQLIEPYQGLIKIDPIIRFTRYGTVLSILKVGAGLTIGAFASKYLYSEIAPTAGACVLGSRFGHYNADDEIVCPIINESLAYIGKILGNLSIGLLAGVTAFPMLELFDFAVASSENPYNLSRGAKYLLSIVGAACRVLITAYVANQNSEDGNDTFNVTYVCIVFFLFTFFNMAVLGPVAFTGIKNIFKDLFYPCFEPEDAALPLIHNDKAEMLSHCQQLQYYCLFHPDQVEEKLSISEEEDDNFPTCD